MKQTRIALIISGISILLSCSTTRRNTVVSDATVFSFDTSNRLSKKQIKEGWKLLFDGETMQGWHRYGGGPVGSAWQVVFGSIVLDNQAKQDWQVKNGGDIISDEEFTNFHLIVNWKISKGGNSGIIFLSQEDTARYKHPWETGPEMQILDNEFHNDGKIVKHRAGDLYDLISAYKESANPVGEWNQSEIIFKDGHLQLFLNGVNVVTTTLWTDNWNQLVQSSKWRKYKDFAKFKSGRISLQDHGDKVWFRGIKIKKL